MEKFIKSKQDTFVTSLCEFLSSDDKLVYCICNQFGNYVIQTLLINYQGDQRLDPVISVSIANLDYQEEFAED